MITHEEEAAIAVSEVAKGTEDEVTKLFRSLWAEGYLAAFKGPSVQWLIDYIKDHMCTCDKGYAPGICSTCERLQQKGF